MFTRTIDHVIVCIENKAVEFTVVKLLMLINEKRYWRTTGATPRGVHSTTVEREREREITQGEYYI